MKKIKTIEVGASIFQENDAIARSNRELLSKSGVKVFNIMGSPGSGKTAILELTASVLGEDYSLAVIEGDIKGSLDGERLGKLGLEVVQINTGGACHLDANMVRKALENMPLKEIDILFIENVGNLVCPAEFKIGEDKNVIVSSVPEGEEKPLKYPLMFRISDLCILNKTDLLQHTSFSVDGFTDNVKTIAPDLRILPLSCKTSEGLAEWTKYLGKNLLPTVSLPNEEQWESLLRDIAGEKTVIAGLGDRLKGDDGAGCIFAEKLIRSLRRDNIKVINAENAIDNYLGVIEKFMPRQVIIIDVVEFGGKPGDVRILDVDGLKETTSSTHTFSLPLIFEHIKRETGARCRVMAIQPEKISFSEDVSQAVSATVECLAEDMAKNL